MSTDRTVHDDLDLVAEPFLEGRAQRAVDQAGRQDRGLAGPALTPEERAGDLAGRVGPLLDVDREREEIDPLAGLGADAGGDHLGLSVGNDDGAVGELRELAGLHRQVVRADGARHLGDHPVGSSLDSWARGARPASDEGRRPVVSGEPPNRSGLRGFATENRPGFGASLGAGSWAVVHHPLMRRRPPAGAPAHVLAAKTELRDDVAIAGDVLALQVLQQPAAAADEHQQAAAAVVIVFVGLEVIGQIA